MMRQIELIQIMPAPEGLAILYDDETEAWYSLVYCFGLYKETEDGLEMTYISPIVHHDLHREADHGMHPIVDEKGYIMTCSVESAEVYCKATKSARQKILSLLSEKGGAF